MRRKEKEITDPAEMEAIIRQSAVCRLGMIDGDRPYVVPLSFGYQDGTLYFHSAQQGHKIDLLKSHPRVCVEFDRIHETMPAEKACDWSVRFESLIGFGRAEFVEDLDEKRQALDRIMAQYAKGAFSYPEAALKATAVFKVVLERMTGKRSA